MSLVKGIKVGTSNITASFTDNDTKDDSKIIEVVAVNLKSIASPDNTVYTGFEQKPEPNVIATVGTEDKILEKDVDYTLSYKNNINVGTATVIATGIGNFTGIVNANWTINGADITIVISDQSYVYDGTVQGYGLIVSTINNQAPTVKYGIKEGIYDIDEVPTISHVSDSKMIYYQVSAPNHNTVVGSYRLEMTPRTAELVWGTLSWIYDGKPHKTTCVVGNLIGDDVCDVNLEGNDIIDIGSSIVRVISLTNTDYALPLNGLEQTLVIKGDLFIKDNGIWIPVKDVYRKTSSGWTRIPYEQLQIELAKNSGKFVRKMT